MQEPLGAPGCTFSPAAKQNSMASTELKEGFAENQELLMPGMMGELPTHPSKRSSPWAKGHCDSLLDRIDVELSRLQGSSPKIQGSEVDGAAPIDGTGATSSAADPGRWNAGGDGDLHPQKVDYGRELSHLPESNNILGDPSKSDSVCTEDFAAEFCKGLVDLLPSSDEDEAASALPSLSSDAGPPSFPLGNQPEKSDPSPPFSSLKAASDFCSLDLESKSLPTDISKGERSGDLAPYSGELPLQSRTQPQTCLESVGGQVSGSGQKCSNGMDTGRGGWPWLRTCYPKLRSSGLNSVDRETETSGESGILEPQQGRKGSVGSSDRGQGPSRGSILLTRVEDRCLLQSWQTATSRTRVPPATAERGPSAPPGGEVTQQGPLGGSGGYCLWTFGGEDRRELRWPASLCPPKAQLPGRMQRPPPSGYGMGPGMVNALTDSQKPPGLSAGLQETWAVDGPGADVCDEAPDTSKTADSHVQKPPLTQKDLRRATSSTISGTDEKEQVRLRASNRWSSSKFRSWTPEKPPDPPWKEAATREFIAGQFQAAPGTVQADSLAEDAATKLGHLEETVRKREQELKLEEEKLVQKMAQIQEMETSLHTTLQRKKNVALELEALQDALQERQEVAERLELCMEEHRNKAEEARADLVLLEYKREVCLKELLELEQELSMLRRQSSQYWSVQIEVSRLISEREQLKDQIRCLEDQLSPLELRLKSSRAKLTSMEEMANEKTKALQEALLSEKDLEIVRMRKMLSVLEEEKAAQDSAMRNLKDQHQQQLRRLQQEACQEKDKELQQLRLEKEQAFQELAESSQEVKATALREQAIHFQKEIEQLHKAAGEQEKELARQQQAMKQQAVTLKLEAQEMVQTALTREQKKWEGNTRAALQMQREALAEQDRKKWVDLQKALEKEKKLSCALQDETADLRKKIQGLENQVCSFQGEKRVTLKELQERLQKEKAEALKSLREQLEQERMQERGQMRAEMQQLEGDRWRLQAECSQAALREQEAHAQAEHADRGLAREIALVCQQLQDLLPKKTTGLPHRAVGSLTSGTAFQVLREVSEEIQGYLQDQTNELEMQRQCVFQIQREKEQEMRDQEEKLRLESHLDLEALKERLVQEHLRDILTLQRSWLKEGRVKESPTLCPQPQERVGELHGAQKKVAHGEDCQWNEEEADIGSRRWPSRNRGSPRSERGPFSKGWSKYLPPPALCSPSLKSGPIPGQRPLTTPNLLHHLQSRIRKLRAENSLCSGGSLGDLRSSQGGKRPQSLERSSSGLFGRTSWE